jgi:hypothetical protein
MTYRLLPAEEWDRLSPLFTKYSMIPPASPATGLPVAAAVAEDDQGKIIGCWILQPVFHVEPLILEDRHVNFVRLFNTLLQSVEGKTGLAYYGFTDREVTDGMAEMLGAVNLPVKVWAGVVK